MSKEKTPHKHAALIHAWADGAEIQFRDRNRPEWIDSNNPTWTDEAEYRIKPSAPETRMTNADLNQFQRSGTTWCADAREVANAAIARALADGDVVLP